MEFGVLICVVLCFGVFFVVFVLGGDGIETPVWKEKTGFALNE